ncbi:hypothetical protein [Robiginitalea aestuariiviva]|uniref:hypothetical protein n=1 Tax=Robiginitalea aestuariiviva TaxID=3036903 RepID=UPI0030C72096
MSDELFEQLDFTPNPLYEKIISDLMEQHYSVVPGFLSGSLTMALRTLLLEFF